VPIATYALRGKEMAIRSPRRRRASSVDHVYDQRRRPPPQPGAHRIRRRDSAQPSLYDNDRFLSVASAAISRRDSNPRLLKNRAERVLLSFEVAVSDVSDLRHNQCKRG
jgi:hypothetical protein